jgi:uncharacterized protein (DUF302 family)
MLRNIAKLLPVLLVATSLGTHAADDGTMKSDKKPSKLPSQDLRQATPMPYNIQLPPTRPEEEHIPNTVQPSISPEARANAVSTMMAANPFALRDMIAMMVVKYPAKEGLSFDDVVEAMKVKANDLNFKYVGVNPLWKDIVAITGNKDTPRVEFYSFCDAMIARQILDYSLEFAAFLPCRIAVVEDANKKIWVMTLDWDVRWLDASKNPNKIPDQMRENSIKVRDAIDKIMRAGALGEF